MVIRDKRLFGFSVTNYRELSMNFTNHTNVVCVI